MTTLGVERTATGTCRFCGEKKGLRRDGRIAVHKTGEGEARMRCPGYGQRPKDVV